ncbi:MAG: hypothetical protein ACQEXJ_17390 [Myxococcota bacterium]
MEAHAPARARSATRALALTGTLAALALLAAGCAEQGSGVVTGERLSLSSCEHLEEPRVFEPFELPLTFMGLVRERDRVQIRMAPAERLAADDDQVVIFVPDLSAARDAIAADGQAVLPLGPGTEADDSVARVGLSLHDSCPEAVQPLVSASGELVFTRLGVKKGQQVVGTMTFELEDKRTGALVGVGFQGVFDFQVEVGTPYQLFSDPRGQQGVPAGE